MSRRASGPGDRMHSLALAVILAPLSTDLARGLLDHGADPWKACQGMSPLRWAGLSRSLRRYSTQQPRIVAAIRDLARSRAGWRDDELRPVEAVDEDWQVLSRL